MNVINIEKLYDMEILNTLLPNNDEIPEVLQQLVNEQFGTNLSPFYASWKSSCEANLPKVIAWLRTGLPQTVSAVANQMFPPTYVIIRNKTRCILEQHFANLDQEIPSAIHMLLEKYPFEQLLCDPNHTLNDFARSIANELMNPLRISVTERLQERFHEGGIPAEIMRALMSYQFDRIALDTNETFENRVYRITNHVIWAADLYA